VTPFAVELPLAVGWARVVGVPTAECSVSGGQTIRLFTHPTKLRPDEYTQVVTAMEHLGFTHGWVQECASADHYTPDFTQESPFGE
jgi:hypothetical protein